MIHYKTRNVYAFKGAESYISENLQYVTIECNSWLTYENRYSIFDFYRAFDSYFLLVTRKISVDIFFRVRFSDQKCHLILRVAGQNITAKILRMSERNRQP